CVFYVSLFFLLIPSTPRCSLFPYTTLFRSRRDGGRAGRGAGERAGDGAGGVGVAAERDHAGDDAADVARRAQPGVEADRDGVERSEEHTSELQSRFDLVCRLLLGKINTDSD